MRLVDLVVWPENNYGMTARIGYGDFVFSFFSTISYHMEGVGNWGKKFPRLILDLCDHGVVANENLGELEEELKIIYKELERMPLSAVIYDIEELCKPMPADLLPSAEEKVESLAQLWITPRGHVSYFDSFINSIADAKNRNGSVLLMYAPETAKKDTMRKPKDKGRKYWLDMVPINYG